MLEVYNLLLDFDFRGDYCRKISWITEETLNLGLLNIVGIVIDYDYIRSWTEYILALW